MEIHPATTSTIRAVTGTLTAADRWDHWLARWGINRSGHRVEPGLYALGQPGPDSPVCVTANYTLSFDALRTGLAGMDAYLLVLDTQGINVWCAAGKGTFGTDELVRRITVTGLPGVVRHRRLVLPQLGAPGVAAHAVAEQTGFTIAYGPVHAADLPAYLAKNTATPDMRRIRFPLRDRLVLIPVELVAALLPLLVVALVLRSWPAVTAILAGVVAFPILLPWLPTANFSTKGFILGGLAVLPFVAAGLLRPTGVAWPLQAVPSLSNLLLLPPVTAFLALNFTGSTPYTSRSGVAAEIRRYAPVMAWMFGAGLLLAVIRLAARALGA